jgi:PKD repeat protein
MKQLLLNGVALLAAVVMAGCTTKSQEAPPLAGPSEYGTSIAIAIAPDVLTQDGASQSLITVTARDANGQPLRNVSLRAEIIVDGVAVDFGSLSARNLVTGSDGRATVVYTAPPSPRITVDNRTVVNIVITPVGTDFNNTAARTASIRLVPPGIVVGPDGLIAAFVFTPTTPVDNQTILFDATASTSAAGNPIASYAWNFGDGDRGSGVTATHDYGTAGSYVVTLTISDALGRSAFKASSITVTAGVGPTAAFSSSPAAPLVNQAVTFNGAATRAAPGRTIDSYEWDFGDGASGSGITASHTYTAANVYNVVLTVTDDTGKTGSIFGVVTVGGVVVPGGLAADFTFTPSAPSEGQTVLFDGSLSASATGAAITRYSWTFGDGSNDTGATTGHAYTTAGSYVVTLTVTDSRGNVAQKAKNVLVTIGASPIATFTSSPAAPVPGSQVNFNGSGSRASAGHTITSYVWDFGDGTPFGAGPTPSHVYGPAGVYKVVLTVTDDSGKQGTFNADVTVKAPAVR